MEREQVEFETPAGKKVLILKKLTAGERNQLRRVLTNNVKMEGEQVGVGPANTKREIDLKFVDEMESEAIRICVKQYGDLTEGIVEALLNADWEEYDAVYKKVEEIHKDTFASFFQTK